MPASRKQKPVVIEQDRVVSIQGGLLTKLGLASGITMQSKEVNDKIFVSIDRKYYKMKRFLNEHWEMVEYLKHLRNEKVKKPHEAATH